MRWLYMAKPGSFGRVLVKKWDKWLQPFTLSGQLVVRFWIVMVHFLYPEFSSCRGSVLGTHNKK